MATRRESEVGKAMKHLRNAGRAMPNWRQHDRSIGQLCHSLAAYLQYGKAYLPQLTSLLDEVKREVSNVDNHWQAGQPE